MHKLEDLAEVFDNARAELGEFLNDIISRWEDEIAERSERWLGSDAGGEARERLQTVIEWGEASQDEIGIDVMQLEGDFV
jgi:hypothetical protein